MSPSSPDPRDDDASEIEEQDWPLKRSDERWTRRGLGGWGAFAARAAAGPLTLLMDVFLYLAQDREWRPKPDTRIAEGLPDELNSAKASRMIQQLILIVIGSFGGGFASRIFAVDIVEKILGTIGFILFLVAVAGALVWQYKEEERLVNDPWGPLTPPKTAAKELPTKWRNPPTSSWPQAATLGVRSAAREQEVLGRWDRLWRLWRAHFGSALACVVVQPSLVLLFGGLPEHGQYWKLWTVAGVLTVLNVTAVSAGLLRWFRIGQDDAERFRARAARLTGEKDEPFAGSFEFDVRDAFHRVESQLARMEAMLRDRGTSI